MINKKRLVSLTQKVISYNSENPPGNELALSKFIEEDMRSLDLEIKKYSFEKNRPNIVATLKGVLPRKEAAAQAILLTPHFDTVPYGKGWKFNPLGGTIHRGCIYGRGASDDKGNLAGCMEVMRSLVEDKVKLKKDVIMAATVDEETGSHAGIIPLLDKKILKPALALVMDSDDFKTIIVQKGLIHARIQIFGKRAHGAYNWRGVNAIEIAARVINKLKQHKFKFKKHPMLREPTMNVGVIKGGDKVNIVCDFCEFALDTRYLPGMTPEQVLADIKKIIRSETDKFKIEIDDLQYPYEMNKNHPGIKLYLKVAQKMKCKTVLQGSEGATVITFFKKHNIPAFATGFGTSGTAHITDEFIKIDTLERGTRLLEEYVKEYDKI
jgi:acetylornithine deacetylase/succinyl-diaminopimelate desuccinylase family protein